MIQQDSLAYFLLKEKVSIKDNPDHHWQAEMCILKVITSLVFILTCKIRISYESPGIQHCITPGVVALTFGKLKYLHYINYNYLHSDQEK